MRVLTSVHHLNAAAGVFADSAAAAGCELVEWLPHEAPPPSLDGFGAAIIFGGEAQVDDEDGHPWLRPEKLLLHGCSSGGSRRSGSASAHSCRGGRRRRRAPVAAPEIGWYEIELTAEAASDPLLGELPERFEVAVPPLRVAASLEATVLARSPACLQAFRLDGLPGLGRAVPSGGHACRLQPWLDE